MRKSKLSWDPYSLMPPFRFEILLFRRIANAIDEAEMASVSDSANTWLTFRYIPAITYPTEDPIRKIKRFILNDIPPNCFGVEVSTTFTEPICINANPTATKTRTEAIEASVE